MTALATEAHLRWRIERDDQDLKQEVGLDHYEGRSWRGFHHHATLAIAAYAFLVAQRLDGDGVKKTPSSARRLPYPRSTSRAAAPRAQRHVADSIATLRHRLALALIHRIALCSFCSSTHGAQHL